MSEALIVAIIALLGSVVAIVVPLLKKPHETKKLDAETVKLYTEAMEKAQQTFMARIDNLERRIEAVEEENERLTDWAERLVVQVKSYGGVPVRITLPKVKVYK